ncbi:MAG: BatD family protein, partial [Myxococcales bacterium]|nr:BatD family protein [Myxococcales bacterium]
MTPLFPRSTSGRTPYAWLFAIALAVLVAPSVASAQSDGSFSSIGDDSAGAKELALPDGPDDIVFLRAVADKNKAVIGEQVTVSIYLYHRVAYEMSERSDAKYTDFLRYSLLTDPSATPTVYTQVKNQRYGARLVERVALIPLRAGKLNTGSMTARFKGRQIGARVLKASNDLTIDVEEPPVSGRPKGYALGDVGQFSVSATVKPRATKQGGSVGVVVKVEGVGNPPSKLSPPPIAGAKWLEPRTRENISGKTGKVAGARYFEYVLRLGNAGETQLGKLEVPYYDPVQRAYV